MHLRPWILLVALALAACGGTDGDRAASGDTGSSTSAPPTTTLTTTTDRFALPDAGAFTEEDVTVGTDAHPLEGTLRLPQGASSESPVPGAVIVHGAGPQDEDGTVLGQRPYRDVAEGLADQGVAVLTYEKRTRAYADEYGPESRYTVQDETVDDAVSALGVLASTPGVDPERVVLVGHDLGAMVAPRILASSGPVAGIVLLAPPGRPLEDLAVAQYRYLAELDGVVTDDEAGQLAAAEEQADAIRADGLEPGAPPLLGRSGDYWVDLRGYDPVAAVGELTVPVLVIWGERDYQVTADDFSAWAALAEGDADVTVSSRPGLNHNFVAGEGPSSPDDYARVGTVDPGVIDDIAAFVLG